MSKLIYNVFAQELSKKIEACRADKPMPHDAGIDIGEMLDAEFEKAGYKLELHQSGIRGTSVLAVKIP